MAIPAMRQARVLALCQALYTAALSVDLTLTGLVGYTLAPDKALATLPFALITVASALTAIAAAFLIERLGRRFAFCLGGLACTIGGLVSVWAIYRHHFLLFCVGTALVGVFQAFARFYRLAAADAAPAPDKPRAISVVLTGGVVAAVCGPAIAAWSVDMMQPLPFAGAYLVVAAFGVLTVLLLAIAYRDPASLAATTAGDGLPARPLGEIVRQPVFVAAFANNGIGNAVMMFMMTATPIAAVACNHTITQGAQIIEWHLVGMYAPSFFSGWLLQRFGNPVMLMSGIALSALASVVALCSTSLPAFYVALLCLGVGWNFMFVGGTTLLAGSYRTAERARTQAASEFSAAVLTALATLAAGQVLHHWGWSAVNLAVFPALLLALVMTAGWQRHARRQQAMAVAA
ncbi:Predicted arabinose efflux permease, MFS family [Cupriavidus sp. YR651]|uniref:MFS transporter n=1 Tax=Cupriavidus sp. YR651 TaxID=1855315 RepID=UPI00088EBF69|nr:MFS transporter [Cupriavidus sp. YR651]SDD15983.1 Predicted arabinose efflux permease, MFS family [Cupriavidus sp. YR651]